MQNIAKRIFKAICPSNLKAKVRKIATGSYRTSSTVTAAQQHTVGEDAVPSRDSLSSIATENSTHTAVHYHLDLSFDQDDSLFDPDAFLTEQSMVDGPTVIHHNVDTASSHQENTVVSDAACISSDFERSTNGNSVVNNDDNVHPKKSMDMACIGEPDARHQVVWPYPDVASSVQHQARPAGTYLTPSTYTYLTLVNGMLNDLLIPEFGVTEQKRSATIDSKNPKDRKPDSAAHTINSEPDITCSLVKSTISTRLADSDANESDVDGDTASLNSVAAYERRSAILTNARNILLRTKFGSQNFEADAYPDLSIYPEGPDQVDAYWVEHLFRHLDEVLFHGALVGEVTLTIQETHPSSGTGSHYDVIRREITIYLKRLVETRDIEHAVLNVARYPRAGGNAHRDSGVVTNCLTAADYQKLCADDDNSSCKEGQIPANSGALDSTSPLSSLISCLEQLRHASSAKSNVTTASSTESFPPSLSSRLRVHSLYLHPNVHVEPSDTTMTTEDTEQEPWQQPAVETLYKPIARAAPKILQELVRTMIAAFLDVYVYRCSCTESSKPKHQTSRDSLCSNNFTRSISCLNHLTHTTQIETATFRFAHRLLAIACMIRLNEMGFGVVSLELPQSRNVYRQQEEVAKDAENNEHHCLEDDSVVNDISLSSYSNDSVQENFEATTAPPHADCCKFLMRAQEQAPEEYIQEFLQAKEEEFALAARIRRISFPLHNTAPAPVSSHQDMVGHVTPTAESKTAATKITVTSGSPSSYGHSPCRTPCRDATEKATVSKNGKILTQHEHEHSSSSSSTAIYTHQYDAKPMTISLTAGLTSTSFEIDISSGSGDACGSDPPTEPVLLLQHSHKVRRAKMLRSHAVATAVRPRAASEFVFNKNNNNNKNKNNIESKSINNIRNVSASASLLLRGPQQHWKHLQPNAGDIDHAELSDIADGHNIEQENINSSLGSFANSNIIMNAMCSVDDQQRQNDMKHHVAHHIDNHPRIITNKGDTHHSIDDYSPTFTNATSSGTWNGIKEPTLHRKSAFSSGLREFARLTVRRVTAASSGIYGRDGAMKLVPQKNRRDRQIRPNRYRDFSQNSSGYYDDSGFYHDCSNAESAWRVRAEARLAKARARQREMSKHSSLYHTSRQHTSFGTSLFGCKSTVPSHHRSDYIPERDDFQMFLRAAVAQHGPRMPAEQRRLLERRQQRWMRLKLFGGPARGSRPHVASMAAQTHYMNCTVCMSGGLCERAAVAGGCDRPRPRGWKGRMWRMWSRWERR